MKPNSQISEFCRPRESVGSASASGCAAFNSSSDSIVRDRGIFEYMLEGAITNAQVAFESAKGLSIFSCTARDIARQRRMNQMVENQIIQIEEMFNIFVACTRRDEINHVPMPPAIKREQTLINFDKAFGCSMKQSAEIFAQKKLESDAAWAAAKAQGEAIRKAKRNGLKRKI